MAQAHAGHHDGPDATGSLLHLLPAADQFIVFLALGLAMGRLESEQRNAPYWTHVLSFSSGFLFGQLLAPWDPVTMRAISLVLAGLLLVNPGNRASAAPAAAIGIAAFASGLSCGTTLPPVLAIPIFAGAILSLAFLLAVGALLFWERFQRPWFHIAIRIGGSWLVAIGIILLGSTLR